MFVGRSSVSAGRGAVPQPAIKGVYMKSLAVRLVPQHFKAVHVATMTNKGIYIKSLGGKGLRPHSIRDLMPLLTLGIVAQG